MWPHRPPYSAPYNRPTQHPIQPHTASLWPDPTLCKAGGIGYSPEYEAKTAHPIMARFASYGLRRFSLGISTCLPIHIQPVSHTPDESNARMSVLGTFDH
jgi:hypothetical protein